MGGISLTGVQFEKTMAKAKESVDNPEVPQVTETVVSGAEAPKTEESKVEVKSSKKKFKLLAGSHSVSDSVRAHKGDVVESDDDLVKLHGKEKFEYVVE